MVTTDYLWKERLLPRMQIKACMATERSVLVSALPETIYSPFSYVAQAHAIEPAHILGTPLVLDAESTGTSDTEALSCE